MMNGEPMHGPRYLNHGPRCLGREGKLPGRGGRSFRLVEQAQAVWHKVASQELEGHFAVRGRVEALPAAPTQVAQLPGEQRSYSVTLQLWLICVFNVHGACVLLKALVRCVRAVSTAREIFAAWQNRRRVRRDQLRPNAGALARVFTAFRAGSRASGRLPTARNFIQGRGF